ncbi:hypothetical protein Q0590_34965 [Rhodocytophaga aerolata]|uniref:Uncharacterized protein n=1 Tax=Rhodocytophaga aerolata TaxID=455078 RepID=A0ABT8RKR1_9BACT|nr:hypothetical protein [Rhodocytophaga aerolata]MDO1451527.1 hypothetical protein [Rhodocytophaga aerolata]
MKRKPLTLEQIIRQLEITSMRLKAHIDGLKKEVEAFDEFLLEHRKQMQGSADSGGQHHPSASKS